MSFKINEEEVVSIKEMNELLRFCSLEREYTKDLNKNYSYKYYTIKNKEINFELTFKNYKKKTKTYICRKDADNEDEKIPRINGMEAYRRMQLETVRSCGWKVKDTEHIKKYFNHEKQKYVYEYSSRPLLYSNPDYDKMELDVYVYDLNSAYSFAMLKPIPDTSVEPRVFDMVGENEIGFNLNQGYLELAFTGELAYYVFPLIESPFKSFVEKYYKMKKNAKNPMEKMEAKDTLNFAVGQLQNHDPFIRATIIGRCNKLIKNLMDENTIMCNTDAIYSLAPRPDLDIGDGLGQWKLEYEGWFKKIQLNYQTTKDVHVRGVSSKWFNANNNFKLGEDDLPKNGNKYFFDEDTMQIIMDEVKIDET